ncbi:MAG: response regulator [Stellaceae bacterium]
MPYSNVKSRGVTKAPARPEPTTAASRRALIVDTDPASARLCGETLARMGFAIDRVNGGVAAVVAARGRAPDLIVMDAQLSDASARETIGWLRANPSLKSIPIVVLGITDALRLPASDAGAMTAVTKPLTAAAIERAVRGLCE